MSHNFKFQLGQQQHQDHPPLLRLLDRFVDAADLHANAVKVVTERGVVYLMGRVTEREAARATEIARGVGGVNKVVRVFEIVTESELADQLPRSSRS